MVDWLSRAPLCGTCPRCGCPLGYHARRWHARWYCCGPCAESDRCLCGCRPQFARPVFSDDYVPLRRMYAARPADELRRCPPSRQVRARAYPFADPRRGS